MQIQPAIDLLPASAAEAGTVHNRSLSKIPRRWHVTWPCAATVRLKIPPAPRARRGLLLAGHRPPSAHAAGGGAAAEAGQDDGALVVLARARRGRDLHALRHPKMLGPSRLLAWGPLSAPQDWGLGVEWASKPAEAHVPHECDHGPHRASRGVAPSVAFAALPRLCLRSSTSVHCCKPRTRPSGRKPGHDHNRVP